MYVKENLWQELPKATGGFGQLTQAAAEKQFPTQMLPSTTHHVGRWGPVVGRYSLVKPELIMWETPVSSPMSTDEAAEAKVWAGMGGFGQPTSSEVAVAGAGLALGSLVLYGVSLLILGGVIIWVVRAVRSKD